MKVEDRGPIKRVINSDFEGYLSEVKGKAYCEYRKNWNSYGNLQKAGLHPMQLNIELTSYCNLRCKMCYYNFVENRTREHMSLELVDQIVREAGELHVESLWLGAYSESLLHPNIIEVIKRFAKVKSMDFWLATNGVLLNRELSETIVDIPLTWLTVSLDAATSETYKQIRGGRLEVVERNILQFLEIREMRNSQLPFLRVSFVDMKENHKELEMFQEKWAGKADIVDVQTLVDFSENGIRADVNKSFICRDVGRLLSIKYDGELLPCCNSSYKNKEERFFLQNTSIQQFWESDFHKKLLDSVRCKQYLPCCAECVRRYRPL